MRRVVQMQKSIAAALFSVACGVLAILLLVPLSLQAQVGTADVLGTVTDPSGAVVPNAKVTIKNLGTAAMRTMSTNAVGDYVFTTLPNSSYALSVEAQGFKSFTIESFPLGAGERARYDVKLETGAITEKVEVTGEIAALQTDSSTVSSTVDDKAIQELPLNNRQFIGSLQIQAGMFAGNQGSTTNAGSPQDRRPDATLVANGQTNQYNNRLIDGFDNNDRLNGIIGVQPSVDGIEEVVTDTVSYRAEYGRTAGAVINVITKSGTNKFHGSAYDYFGNDKFNAPSYDFLYPQTSAKPEYRQNNFGGSIGGPIWKNKTFFFFDIEEERMVYGITYNTNVPTAFERTNVGNFTDAGDENLNSNTLGVANCTDAAGVALDVSGITGGCNIDPVMLKMFNLYPASQTDANGIGSRLDTVGNTQFGDVWDLRIDHRFSDKNLFFARYADNPVTTSLAEPWAEITSGPDAGIYPGGGQGFLGPSSTKSRNMQLDFVHIFSPALVMDLKAGYTRINIATVSWNYGKGASDKLGIPGAHIPGMPQTDGLMNTYLATGAWNDPGDANSVPQINKNNAFQYGGSLTYNRGTHTFKVGGGLIRRQVDPWSDDFIDGFFIFANAPFSSAQANFLTGHPLGTLRGNAIIQPGYRTWEPSVYAQDDWRVTRKLTLNMGLRYDIFTPFTEVQNRYTNYVPSSESFIQGSTSPTIGVATDHSNFAPRFGFAYTVTPKTVVHGAFGISFFPPDLGLISGGGGAAPVSVVNNANPPWTYSYSNFGPGSFGPVFTGPPVPTASSLINWQSNNNITLLNAKSLGLSSSYAEQMNLAAQREIGANTVSLNYVGVMGRQLLHTVNAQTPDPPGAGVKTPSYHYADLPFISTINYTNNGASSNYNAMQVVYVRRNTKGLTLNANNTWAHGLDDTDGGTGNPGPSTPSNPHADYGNSGLDIRQRVAVSGSYDLPFAKSAHGLESVLLKGWQVTGLYYWQTGLPFTVTSKANMSQADVAALCPDTCTSGIAFMNVPGVSVDRPNYDPSKVDIKYAASKMNGNFRQMINMAAFHPQTPGTVGNQAPGQIRGPRDRKADMGIHKEFPLFESMKLQFRAECFNITNTPNFNIATNFSIAAWTTDATTGAVGPASVPILQGSTVGNISDTAANENPRQFQFALKLLF